MYANLFQLITLILSALTTLGRVESAVSWDYDVKIKMPGVQPTKPDVLICTSVKLRSTEAYIVKFSPHALQTRAHHMMVYGCEKPANKGKWWVCDQDDVERTSHGVCANGQSRKILFAWALNAPAMQLPKGVGLRVSGGTKTKHVIVQIHYARKLEAGDKDYSGVTLHITHTRPPQQMGYYILAHTGTVEPQQQEVHLETVCRYDGDDTIYPIGFRTHSHNLGVVTSGYRIRDGVWKAIGIMSPQLPQTFYKVSNPGMSIRKGDFVASRCTMNSMSRTEPTPMGPSNHDEMCNFYIMYSTSNQANLENVMCFPQSPNSNWNNTIEFLFPSPIDASSLLGIPNNETILAKFNMTSQSDG